LNPTLTLNVGGTYSTVPDKWEFDEKNYDTTYEDIDRNSFQGLGAIVESINQTSDDVNV
jgi:hypothetical protein